MEHISPPERPEDEFFDISDIADVLERWSKPSSNRDPRFVMISRAINSSLSDPVFRQKVEFMIRSHNANRVMHWAEPADEDDFLGTEVLWQHRQDFSYHNFATGFLQELPYPEYGANLIHRGLWHAWRKSEDPAMRWPDAFISEEHCSWAISAVMQNEELWEDFGFNIAWRPIQTSYPNRMVGPMLGIKAYEERFGGQINMLSVGHSWGSGEKKLLLGMDFPTPTAYDWADGPRELYSRDPGMTEQLDRLKRQHPPVKNIYGVDLFPGDRMDDSMEWAISSFYPGEQMNRKFMAQINMLKNSKPHGYHSFQADFANSDAVENLKHAIEDKVDVVLFSTVLYQQTSDERRRMVENAMSIASENGLILVLDFAEKRSQVRNNMIVEADNPVDELNFPSDWEAWTYRLHILDLAKLPDNSSRGFETAMLFDSGRCGSVLLNPEFKNKLFRE